MDALCKELIMRQAEQTHPIKTIYFGGGTPTILTIAQLQQIIHTLQQHYDLSQVEELTIEANPEDLTPDYLTQLTSLHFFNRLSIGIQSFHNADLKTLNRRHSAQQAISAVTTAHQMGITNISIDLIYGLPKQTLNDWNDNLAILTQIAPYLTHLSCYALSIEPNTIIHRQIEMGMLQPADETTVLQDYQSLHQWITQNGFQQYEISSYCRPNYASKHNSRYWNRTPYMGVGAGAHSFHDNIRRWNINNKQQYIAAIAQKTPFYETEHLSTKDCYNEYLMTALRTTAGIDLNYIAQQFPQWQQHLLQTSQKYQDTHLLQHHNHHLTPTPQGLLHADGIAADLFI